MSNKNHIRTFLSLLLCCLLSMSLVACSGSSDTSNAQSAKEETAKIANPIVEYDSLAKAEKAAGFQLTVPEAVEVNGEAYEQYYYSTINDSLIEVRYGAEGSEVCYIRKAPVSQDMEDISGDYNVYDTVVEEEVMLESGTEYTVTLKGQGDKFYLATWDMKGSKDNGIYSYAIGIQGVDKDDLLMLVQMVE